MATAATTQLSSINIALRFLCGDGEDVPLHRLVELGEVDADVDHTPVLHLILVAEVDLTSSGRKLSIPN